MLERVTLPDRIGLVSELLLERYLAQEVIAQGGMSVVYRGHDQRLLRPVCIKVFDGLEASSAPAYSVGHDHFIQEAFALSRLAHPNTVRIYDFGHVEREPPLPFHVSEWLAGGTLAERIQARGALALEAALAVLEPIVGALAEAHRAGIIHRDVKPSNILLLDGPVLIAKLADFGIAKTARKLPHEANTGAIDLEGRVRLFSPGWSAPEQILGHNVSPATDVFAFALLIAFVVSGRPLLAQGALMDAVLHDDGVDGVLGRALDGAPLPAAVRRILVRGCRADPRQRHQTIEELWSALAASVAPAAAAPGFAGFHAADDVTATDAGVTPRERATDPLVAGGRVVRVIETDEQIELLHGGAKVRVSLLSVRDGELHLHVKGVNCFVARPDGNPTSAVSLACDGSLRLYSPERRLLARVRCGFGSPCRPGRMFQLGGSSLRVPQPAVLIDFEERQELFLIQQARGA